MHVYTLIKCINKTDPELIPVVSQRIISRGYSDKPIPSIDHVECIYETSLLKQNRTCVKLI